MMLLSVYDDQNVQNVAFQISVVYTPVFRSLVDFPQARNQPGQYQVASQVNTQLPFICPKATAEIPEDCVKSVHS